MKKFEDYHWHDSIVHNIALDRSNPGYNDTLELEVEFYHEDKRSKLIFEDLRYLKMDLNFGIVVNEMILDVMEFENLDEDFKNFYSSWNGFFNDIKLRVFLIDLNSTGSKIKIICESFKVICT